MNNNQINENLCGKPTNELNRDHIYFIEHLPKVNSYQLMTKVVTSISIDISIATALVMCNTHCVYRHHYIDTIAN